MKHIKDNALSLESFRPLTPRFGARVKRSRLLNIRVLFTVLVIVICTKVSFSYSVLTHTEIVDLLWSDQLKPLILERYPRLSAYLLRAAHAYAYGGAVIQDLGYYPFGSVEF